MVGRNQTWLSVLILTVFAVLVSAQDSTMEREYRFKVRYGMLSAGHAVVQYQQKGDTLESRMNMNSSPWLSSLWHLADSIENRVDLRENRLLTHDKTVNQGRYHRRYKVQFSSPDSAWINGERMARDSRGVMDVPQLMHFLETVDLREGDTLHFRIWDGKAADDLSLVGKSARKPLNINPLVKVERVYELTPLQSTVKSRKHGIQMRFWVREKLPHRPLKMEIKTRYGDIELSRHD